MISSRISVTLSRKKRDNVNVLESSLKISSEVRTLVDLEKCVKINDQNVHDDRNASFSRLVALLEKYKDVIPFFKFKLSLFSISFFKNFQ